MTDDDHYCPVQRFHPWSGLTWHCALEDGHEGMHQDVSGWRWLDSKQERARIRAGKRKDAAR